MFWTVTILPFSILMAFLSEKKSVMDQNDVTRKFGAAHKAVDKFHFPGHVSKKCHETCDPYKMPCFDDINSPVCEQVFSRLNRFTQVKGMNESHFLFFFIYLLDLQNLDIEGRLRSVANPFSAERKEIIEKSYYDECIINDIPRDLTLLPSAPEDELEHIEAVVQNEKELFECQMCDAKYKHQGSLRKHTQKKHSIVQGLIVCELCDSKFQTKKPHTRHLKTHEDRIRDEIKNKIK